MLSLSWLVSILTSKCNLCEPSSSLMADIVIASSPSPTNPQSLRNGNVSVHSVT